MGRIEVQDGQSFAVYFIMVSHLTSSSKVHEQGLIILSQPADRSYSVKLSIDGSLTSNRAVQIGEGGGHISSVALTEWAMHSLITSRRVLTPFQQEWKPIQTFCLSLQSSRIREL